MLAVSDVKVVRLSGVVPSICRIEQAPQLRTADAGRYSFQRYCNGAHTLFFSLPSADEPLVLEFEGQQKVVNVAQGVSFDSDAVFGGFDTFQVRSPSGSPVDLDAISLEIQAVQ